jgi:hypothetical protein
MPEGKGYSKTSRTKDNRYADSEMSKNPRMKTRRTKSMEVGPGRAYKTA